MRILGIVSIQEGDSLLLVLSGKPIPHEILDLGNIHELQIVYVTILLSFDNHIGRDALVAHSLGVGFVVFAGEIDFVADAAGRQTVVALHFRRMDTLAL